MMRQGSVQRRASPISICHSFLILANVTIAQVFNCVGGTVLIVAHPDDDLLFQSPDILSDVSKGCLTSVALTSGDSGVGETYAFSRESGNEAALAEMAGVADVWTEFNANFGGQPVLVRSLKGASGIQKVWFRLPDGDVDGTGYASTHYQTLRELYFGSIGSITSLTGTATFTLATLKNAIDEIIAARQPTAVRSLDYLSQFDAGDHSDHLVSARLVQSLVAGSAYASSPSLQGYMGYPISNLAPNVAGSNYQSKYTAFFAYAQYDNQECLTLSACAARGEGSWLQRQYVVTSALAETSTIGSAQTPVTFPTTPNVALLATASASSAGAGQPASAAIDNVISGYPGNSSAEWSSAGQTVGATFTLTWKQAYNLSAVALYDRPNVNDWMTGGTLTFSDGSIYTFGALENDGSATLFTFNTTITTSSILLKVTSVGSQSSNIGLAEFQAYGYPAIAATSSSTTNSTISNIDLCLSATATASSENLSTGQGASKAIDGLIGGYTPDGGIASQEWASIGGGAGTTLTLTWTQKVQLVECVLYDRPNVGDWITGGTLTFDSGSTVVVPSLNNSGGPTPVSFAAVNTSTLIFTITSATQGNPGLSEIQCYGPAGTVAPSNSSSTSTTTGNSLANDLALTATATASSQSTANGQLASSAIDGVLGGYSSSVGSVTNEWATDGQGVGATLLLTWPSPIAISEVWLADRPNTGDWCTSSTLTFGDGTVINVPALYNNGTPFVVDFATVISSTLLFTVTGVSDSTSNVGLSEIEVFSKASSNATLLSSSSNSTSTSTSSYSLANDLALNATATASSQSTANGQLASSAIDGVLGGYGSSVGSVTNEWATNGQGVGATLLLTWPAPIAISEVWLADRPNTGDWCTSSTLTFGDGTVINVPALYNNGTPLVVDFATVTSSTLLFTVTGVSDSTSNVGLSEIEVFSKSPSNATLLSSSSNSTSNSTSTSTSTSSYSLANDLALNATATASSQSTANGQLASSAIDGVVGGYGSSVGSVTNEWATDGQGIGAWLLLTWPTSITVSTVALGDRPNLSDWCKGGTLTFDDGTIVNVPALNNDGSLLFVNITNITTSTLLFTVTAVSDSTSNVGLGEIEVFGSTSGSSSSNSTATSTSSAPYSTSTAGNTLANDLALNATATASSQASGSGQLASSAIDGVLGGYGSSVGSSSNEWASSGQGVGAWLNLTWPSAISINQIWLADRPNLDDWITQGTLTFDSGAVVQVGSLNNDGTPLVVSFAPIISKSVLFTVTKVSSSTSNAGLSEIFVYGSASSVTTTTSSAPSSSSTVASSSAASSGSSSASSSSFSGSSTLTSASSSASSSIPSSAVKTGSSSASSSASSSSASAPSSSSSSSASAKSSSASAISSSAAPSSSSAASSSKVSSTLSAASSSKASSSSSSSASSSSSKVSSSSVSSSSSASSSKVSSSSSSSSAVPTSSSSSKASSTSSSSSSSSVKTSSTPSSSSVTTTSSTTPSSSSVKTTSTTSTSSVKTTSSTLSSTSTTTSSVKTTSTTPTTTSKATSTTSSSSSATKMSTVTTSSIKTSTSTTPTSTSLPTAAAQATSVNIARLGTATASSYLSTSPPSGAIDGIVGGVNLLGLGTASQEWRSSGGVGSWIQVNWTSNYLMKKAVIYAPVDLLNNVAAGTLTFSDGSSFAVGTLSTAGTTVSLGGNGITVNWMRLTVTGVTLTTTNVGVADIQVYNAVAATTGGICLLGICIL